MSEHDEIQSRFREAMTAPEIAELPYELARSALERLLNQEFSGERVLAEGALKVSSRDRYNGFTISADEPLSESAFGKLKAYLEAVGMDCGVYPEGGALTLPVNTVRIPMMEMLQDINPENRAAAVNDQLDHELQSSRKTAYWAATLPGGRG